MEEELCNLFKKTRCCNTLKPWAATVASSLFPSHHLIAGKFEPFEYRLDTSHRRGRLQQLWIHFFSSHFILSFQPYRAAVVIFVIWNLNYYRRFASAAAIFWSLSSRRPIPPANVHRNERKQKWTKLELKFNFSLISSYVYQQKICPLEYPISELADFQMTNVSRRSKSSKSWLAALAASRKFLAKWMQNLANYSIFKKKRENVKLRNLPVFGLSIHLLPKIFFFLKTACRCRAVPASHGMVKKLIISLKIHLREIHPRCATTSAAEEKRKFEFSVIFWRASGRWRFRRELWIMDSLILMLRLT